MSRLYYVVSCKITLRSRLDIFRPTSNESRNALVDGKEDDICSGSKGGILGIQDLPLHTREKRLSGNLELGRRQGSERWTGRLNTDIQTVNK